MDTPHPKSQDDGFKKAFPEGIAPSQETVRLIKIFEADMERKAATRPSKPVEEEVEKGTFTMHVDAAISARGEADQIAPLPLQTPIELIPLLKHMGVIDLGD